MTAIFTRPLVVLMSCLALGFLIGRVKLRILNSTLATLLVAIVVNANASRYMNVDEKLIRKTATGMGDWFI